MISSEIKPTDFDLHLFAEGNHTNLWQKLGSHTEGNSTHFAVWAPNAAFVSVIGDFNSWNRNAHGLAPLGDSGIWYGKFPFNANGQRYKYFIKSKHHGYEVEKADPFAKFTEQRPLTASIVWDQEFQWEDQSWLKKRSDKSFSDIPISIYELHLGSWQWNVEEGRPLTYLELAEQLPAYIKSLGFTHVQFMPITEYPYDPSWGYQVTGYFAPTSRYGSPEDLKFLINTLHKNDIGVLLDWVPAHFPKDEHGLSFFDGTHLFEHQDPRKGEHPDWGTLIFNYGRNEIQSFLISSAHYWLSEFHFDGLRLDAVASMLYLDYSREHNAWIPNKDGGNENYEAIDFLKNLNNSIHKSFPGALSIAEESTAFPGITKPTDHGGIGFDLKWDMGWMNDSLQYFKRDPVHRKFHHFEITFRMDYAYNENYCLSLSHDEVVHGKQSLINKMPGDRWQQMANLRCLYSYMYALPGKKLNFMGNEFAGGKEWDFRQSLDWHLLQYPEHDQIRLLTKDLNHLYKENEVLHKGEYNKDLFFYGNFSDSERSVISFFRRNEADNDVHLFVFNFTPTLIENYCVGVPKEGTWKEYFNSDSKNYGGSNKGNLGAATSKKEPLHGHQFAIDITIPPLAGIYLKYQKES